MECALSNCNTELTPELIDNNYFAQTEPPYTTTKHVYLFCSQEHVDEFMETELPPPD